MLHFGALLHLEHVYLILCYIYDYVFILACTHIHSLIDPMESPHEREALVPFKPGDITFNKDYNTHFTPSQFKVPANVNKVGYF